MSVVGLPKLLQEDTDNSSSSAQNAKSKQLQTSVKISVHESNKERDKNDIYGRVSRQKPLLAKTNTKARLIVGKKT